MTASELIRNSAEVPGVISSRARLMKSSSMPTSTHRAAQRPHRRTDGHAEQRHEEDQAEEQAPERPPSAPAAVMLRSWRVFGFFAPAGQDTVAASCRVIICCLARDSSVATALPPPLRRRTSKRSALPLRSPPRHSSVPRLGLPCGIVTLRTG